LMKSKKWRKPSVSRLYLCRGWGACPVALVACGHSGVVVMPRYLNGTSDKKNYYANAFYIEKHSVNLKLPSSMSIEIQLIGCLLIILRITYLEIYMGISCFSADDQFEYTLLCYATCEAPWSLN
jgi:starch synthase